MQASSSTIPNNIFNAPNRQHPWNKVGPLPEKAAIWEYGYVINGQAVSSTPEELVKLIEMRGVEIECVWTPETSEPVLPERVPFLVESFRRRRARAARTEMLIGGAIAGVNLLIAIVRPSWETVSLGLLIALGAIFLVQGIVTYRRTRNYTQADAVSDASAERFTSWLSDRDWSGYTITLAGCMLVVGLVQAFNSDGLNAASLVKPSVLGGEILRLLSATLMHADFTQFWLNVCGLLYLSRIIDQTLNRACVPLVFLVAGTLGGIFSVVLNPNSNSVGASGGLMGLLGLIVIAVFFDRTKYPPKYLWQVLKITGLVIVLGFFGFASMDNAAHLGGLLAGLALGWFMLSRKLEDKTLRNTGVASSLVLVFTTAFAIYRMLS